MLLFFKGVPDHETIHLEALRVRSVAGRNHAAGEILYDDTYVCLFFFETFGNTIGNLQSLLCRPTPVG